MAAALTRLKTNLILAAALLPALQAAAAPSASEFNDRANEVVNGVTIFTSQDTASSGVFSLESDNTGAGDANIDLLKLPITYTFGDEDRALRPQIRGVLGSLKSTRSIANGDPGSAADFSRLEVLTVGLAGGVVYRPWKEFSITPLVGAAYSSVERKYDFNNSFSQTNLMPFDKEAFNTSVDVMTYSPTLEMDYTFKEGAATIIPKVRYSHLFNDSTSSESSAIDINSDSGMLQSFVDVNAPLGRSVFGQALGLHPFIVRTDLFGTAKEAQGPNYFHEIGADLTFTDSNRKMLQGFSLGGSYIFGGDFTGYRIGLGLIF